MDIDNEGIVSEEGIENDKILIMRMSGLPPDPDALDEFNDKWRSFYDLVIEHYGNDMKAVHMRLERYEKLLLARFKNTKEVEFPKNREEWKKLVFGLKYPVMVANEKGTENLVLVIGDQLG